MTEKKPKSFRISDDHLRLLDLLIEKRNAEVFHIRSQANMLEVLIKEAAAKEKIKLPK